jgi:hypothetical protein
MIRDIRRKSTKPAGTAPGRVLTSVPATMPEAVSTLADAERVTYLVTAADGSAVTATGLRLTPRSGPAGRGGRSVFWPDSRASIASLMARHLTVAHRATVGD